MGEYADIQIDKDMRRMFGVGYEGSDHVSKPKPAKPKCDKCGKKFNTIGAVKNHMRDYHKQVAAKENQQ